MLLLAPTLRTFAGGIPLSRNSEVSFATFAEARTVLTNRDDFVAALSPFDRSARLQVARAVDDAEYLEFVGRNVREWRSADTNRIGTVIRTLAQKPILTNLPFPSHILLIRTSGDEEGGACYTRQNAVVLTDSELRSRQLDRTIAHELFHVLSRVNPSLRTNLYRILGFHPINPVTLPEELRDRRITNPDGIQNGWCITVTNQGRALPVVPILYSSTDRYDAAKKGRFFEYLIFKFLVVKSENGLWTPQLTNGKPWLLDLNDAGGFMDQVGRNTQYTIHPDEILADNFVKLIMGDANPPTPRILTEMKKVFENLESAKK